jgi:LPS-assembly lipoprotein
MSAPLALIVSAGAAFALAGCGFHPLYAKNDAAAGPGQSLADIYVEPIPERLGYQLRNDLLDILNGSSQSDGARFRLKLTYREQKDPVALQPNATITRYNYRLMAHYELFPVMETTPVKSGDVNALSAYNVALSPYATVIAERDANDRAANDVAERIRIELAVYFRQTANPAK